MRRAFFLVHLYVGLTLGFLAAVIGLTGSLLVFRPELDAAFSSHLLRAPAGDGKVPIREVLANVRAEYPQETVGTVNLPREEGSTIELWTKREGFKIYADPHSGRILGDRQDEESFFGFLFSLHTKFLSGEKGEIVASLGGIGLMLLSLSGLVVWWPRRGQKLRDLLTIKRSAGAKRLTYDLHRAIGFYACALLFVISLMGTGLIWDEPYKAAAERLTGTEAAPGKPKAAKTDRWLPIDNLVQMADEAMPGGRLSRIVLPTKAGDPLTVRKRFPNETHPNGLSTIWIDPSSGAVLGKSPDAGASAAQRAMNLRYPVHIGRWAGNVSRVLHALAGLTPMVLLVTGLLMWQRRLKRSRVRAARR